MYLYVYADSLIREEIDELGFVELVSSKENEDRKSIEELDDDPEEDDDFMEYIARMFEVGSNDIDQDEHECIEL